MSSLSLSPTHHPLPLLDIPDLGAIGTSTSTDQSLRRVVAYSKYLPTHLCYCTSSLEPYARGSY
jgi:hypothetical protein